MTEALHVGVFWACVRQPDKHALNGYRIAGGKPWGGGRAVKTWEVTAQQLFDAIPELARPPGSKYLAAPASGEKGVGDA